jgi:hypothetical protein
LFDRNIVVHSQRGAEHAPPPRKERNVKVKILAAVGILVVLAAVGGYEVHQHMAPTKTAVAGCATTQFTLPGAVKQFAYGAGNLPETVTVSSKVSTALAGTYVRAYRAANVNNKTMLAAPASVNKVFGGHTIYMEKSAGCGNIYAAVSGGQFQTLVFMKKA